MNSYRAFGLNVHSDLIFPELFVQDSVEPDLEISRAPDFLNFDENADKLERSHGRIEFQLSASGMAHFWVQEGRRIFYRREEGLGEDVLRLFLLGSCFGIVLQQRGFVVLHGNAVSTDGKTCKIIVGHRGAGKSTAAAWHYRNGDEILADDVCAITFDSEGHPWVIPSYPQIKLWKASADFLGIATNGLRRIRAEKGKFALPLGGRFSLQPRRLTEVVELSSTNTEVAPILGMDKARCLKEHSYRFHFLEKMGLEAGYMKKIMSLAGQIKIHKGVRRVFNPIEPQAGSP